MKKETAAIRTLGLLILAVSMILYFTSCYTQQKAAKQVNKAILNHPTVAAKITRTAFPCITTKIDSSKYLQSIAKLDSLLAESLVNSAADIERLKVVYDSLLAAQPKDTILNINDCREETESLLRLSSKFQIDNEKKAKLISQLQFTIKNIKPIVEQVKDSADYFLVQTDLNKCNDKYAALFLKHEALTAKLVHVKKTRSTYFWLLLLSIGLLFRKPLIKLLRPVI